MPELPLSEKGEQQAEFVGKRFQTIPIEVIIASDMTRALQTAQAIAEHTQKEVVESVLLQEILRPTAVRGKSRTDPEVFEIMKDVFANFLNPDWKHSDEENYFDLKGRAQKALVMLLERKEERIAVVTHGTIFLMMLDIMLFGEKGTPDTFHGLESTIRISNTGISEVVWENDQWHIRSLSDSAHLGDV